MHIVIDIPDNDYKSLVNPYQFNEHLCSRLKEIVRQGTPLPKGHGAIKDISQIEIPMCEDRSYERLVQVAINAAPTIIEADRSEES